MKKINYLTAVILTGSLLMGCKKSESLSPEPAPVVPVVEFLAPTTPMKRVALLEDFTGIKCGYCPDGHVRAKAILDANPGNFIIIATNAGGYSTPSGGYANYTTVQGTAIDAQAKAAGYPAGTMNRMNCTTLGVNAMSANSPITMDRGQWANAAATVMTMPATVNIGAKATFDPATRILTVKVDMYYTSEETVPNNINVSLLQSKLMATQVNYTPGSVNPTPNYEENHVLRDMITKGNWGETITEATTAGSKISKTFTYTVPADYHGTTASGGGAVVIDDLSVVAFVTRGQLEILNAVEVDVQ